jgi:hypothetical protein
MKKKILIILICLTVLLIGCGLTRPDDISEQDCDRVWYSFISGTICRFVDEDYGVVCYASSQGVGCVKINGE